MAQRTGLEFSKALGMRIRKPIFGAIIAVAIGATPAHADDDLDRQAASLAIWALHGRQATEAEISAKMAWSRCTSRTVDLFSPQQEPATTVAEAAIASCTSEMGQYMAVFGIRYPESMKEATMPDLVARVMQNRARQNSGSPTSK